MLDIIPVLGFNMFKNLVIIAPIDMLVLFLSLMSYLLIFWKSMPIHILTKRYALGQLLKNLEPSRHFQFRCDIERERWLETFRRDYFHATKLTSFMVIIYFLYVIYRILKLLLRGPKDWHRIDQL